MRIIPIEQYRKEFPNKVKIKSFLDKKKDYYYSIDDKIYYAKEVIEISGDEILFHFYSDKHPNYSKSENEIDRIYRAYLKNVTHVNYGDIDIFVETKKPTEFFSELLNEVLYEYKKKIPNGTKIVYKYNESKKYNGLDKRNANFINPIEIALILPANYTEEKFYNVVDDMFYELPISLVKDFKDAVKILKNT